MQTFARQSSTVLTTSLRVVSQLSSSLLEELSYDEYLTALPEQSVCAVLSMEPWQGKALLTFNTTALLTIVDHQLGGPGGDDQPDRPLTDIEQALSRQILLRMLRELAYALEPIAKLTPKLVGLEANAGFVQAAAATDPVVVARMDLSIGVHTSEASLCLPVRHALPRPGRAHQQLGRRGQGPAAQDRQRAHPAPAVRRRGVGLRAVRPDPDALLGDRPAGRR